MFVGTDAMMTIPRCACFSYTLVVVLVALPLLLQQCFAITESLQPVTVRSKCQVSPLALGWRLYPLKPARDKPVRGDHYHFVCFHLVA